MLQKILIAKGTVSRLSRPPAIVVGKWYVTVVCRSCERPIYLLEDKWNGADPNRFVGEGKISTPCRRCGTDTTYDPSELTPIVSKENIESPTPARVEPSTMPRQPISRKYPNAKPSFGPGFLEDRPKAAALVARCIALWTEVEVQKAQLLAMLLQANTEPAVALFLAIHNSRIQNAVLDAVATVVLTDEDYKLYSALMQYSASVEKERNALAHGNFGGSDKIKDGIAWINPLDYVRHGAEIKLTGVTEESMAALRDKVYVYELADLEKIAQDTEHLHTHLGFFTGYMFALHEDTADKDTWRAQRYQELCSEPRIAQELERMKRE